MNRKPIRVSLLPADVEGIVFWTKNFRPFLKHLDAVRSQGTPFYVQYTINGYPRSLENNVVDWRKSVEAVRTLASEFGPRMVVWRYDTILFSSQTPPEFHLRNFAEIASSLEGLVDEAVISFMQLYRKTERNLNQMSEAHGNPWHDPSIEAKRELGAELYRIGQTRGIELTVCSQPDLITVQPPARCIAARRLSDVAGRAIHAKTLGNRPGCECAASRDIGDYDTCPHGCVYCYAVRSQTLALDRFRTHSPESPFLFSSSDDPNFDEGPSQLQGRLDLGI